MIEIDIAEGRIEQHEQRNEQSGAVMPQPVFGNQKNAQNRQSSNERGDEQQRVDRWK